MLFLSPLLGPGIPSIAKSKNVHQDQTVHLSPQMSRTSRLFWQSQPETSPAVARRNVFWDFGKRKLVDDK